MKPELLKPLLAAVLLSLLCACGVGSADISVVQAPSQSEAAAPAVLAPLVQAPLLIDGLAEQARAAAVQRGEAGGDSVPSYPQVAPNAVELRDTRDASGAGI